MFHRFHDLQGVPPGSGDRQNSWYLWALGVDPPHQGQGAGGQVLQPILTQADAAGLPCYLETETERNVAFYRKHGFDVATAGPDPRQGVMVWSLVREPQKP